MVEIDAQVLVAAYPGLARAWHDFDRVIRAASKNAVSLRGPAADFGRERTNRRLPGYWRAGEGAIVG
jgi:hypothetical protein